MVDLLSVFCIVHGERYGTGMGSRNRDGNVV